MPKKDKKAAKKDKGRDPADVVDAVAGRGRAHLPGHHRRYRRGSRPRRSLLDDVASAAQRIRESFDDLRVLEDVRGLRAEIEALSERVAAAREADGASRRPPAVGARRSPRRHGGASQAARCGDEARGGQAAGGEVAREARGGEAAREAERRAAPRPRPPARAAKPTAARRKPAASTRSTPGGST